MQIHFRHLRALGVLAIAAALTLGTPSITFATIFHCASGDVVCLIASIHSANAHPGSHTIVLEPGTYTLTVIDNITDDGPNGLPLIMSRLTITQPQMGAV